jgi:hypothetical protein
MITCILDHLYHADLVHRNAMARFHVELRHYQATIFEWHIENFTLVSY